MFNDLFKGKSVLVTGHTGFKGSWLALWLHKLGAQVTGLALPPITEPSHCELIHLQDLITHIEGDIRDSEVVREAFKKAQPEIVFHLAAQALVRDSYADPKNTFDTNVGGTVNVLEAVRTSSFVKAAVVITSDKCYENREKGGWGYREADAMGGHDPYSASKGAAEIVCAAYRRSYFTAKGSGPHIGFATARAGNVIGGGDWAKDRIVPDCVRALASGQPLEVRNPQAVRPWQHVLDPLFGYLLLATLLLENAEKYSGPWNFGPAGNEQLKVTDLVKEITEGWGSEKIEILPSSSNTLHETNSLRLSIEKATHELHWKPLLDQSTSIDWTVKWYKAWHAKAADLHALSLRQISDFESRAVQEGY